MSTASRERQRLRGSSPREFHRLQSKGLEYARKGKVAFITAHGREPANYQDWKLALDISAPELTDDARSVLGYLIVKNTEAE